MMTVRILAFFNRIFQGQVKFKNYGKKYNLIILDHDASETIYGLKYFQINYLFGEQHWEVCFDYMSFLDTSRYVSTEFRCLQIRFSLWFVLTLDRNTYNLIVWLNMFIMQTEAMSDWMKYCATLKYKYLYFWNYIVVEIIEIHLVFSTSKLLSRIVQKMYFLFR